METMRWAIIVWGLDILVIFPNFLKSKVVSFKSFGNL